MLNHVRETSVGSHYGINFLRKTCCIRLKRKCNVHGMYTVFKKCLEKLECFYPQDSISKFSYVIHWWFSRDVIAAILVDERKRSLISSLRSSTSNCALRHRQEMKINYLGVFKTKTATSTTTSPQNITLHNPKSFAIILSRSRTTMWAKNPKDRPFLRGHVCLLFKSSLRAKLFLWKLVFIHMQSKTNYQPKNFAFRLALKRRQTWTRRMAY